LLSSSPTHAYIDDNWKASETGNERTDLSVYISYALEDLPKAKLLADELSQSGVEVWLDSDDISPGENFVERISSAIKSADTFVALISKTSRRSNFVNSELATAIAARDENRNRRIIPITLSEPDDMPVFLRSYQALDGSTPGKLKNAASKIVNLDKTPNAPVELADFESLKAAIALNAAREAELSREIARTIAENDRAYRSKFTRSLMAAMLLVASAVTIAAMFGLAFAGSQTSAVASAVISSILALLGAVVGFYFGRNSKESESDE